MAFLWIFAPAIVAVATANKENINAVPGCGENPEPPKTEDRQYGRITNVGGCEERVLQTSRLLLPASCTLYCPRKNRTYTRGTRCLKFVNKKFLLERKDDDEKNVNTCHLGHCAGHVCRTGRRPQAVKCTVPEDIHRGE
uniref:Evasin n=1 Tax=Amblyomma americanum TaxID=6943 RepID=A0A0C9S4F7_AMBAM